MSNKDDLMASLMGGSAASGGEKTPGLFGDDDDDNVFQNDPPPFSSNNDNADDNNNYPFGTEILAGSSLSAVPPEAAPPMMPPPPPPPAEVTSSASASSPPPAAAPPAPPSKLAESGLLGMTGAGVGGSFGGGGGGGGLFDDIDQQEAQEEERKRQEEAERLRKQQEEAAERQRREAEEQERQRQAEQQRKMQEEEEERKRREQEQMYQQQMQDQMQSIHLGSPPNGGYGSGGGGYPQQQQQQPPPQYQQQPPMQQSQQYQSPQQPAMQPQQQSYPDPPVTHVSTTFYRDPIPPPGQVPPPQQQQQSRYYQPQQPGNLTAGLHDSSIGGGSSNNNNNRTPNSKPIGGFASPGTQPPPPPIQQAFYGKVSVSEPILIQTGSSMFGLRQPPHWSYQIATEILPQPPHNPQASVWLVRRRFRHVVALEDRLRDDCPGAILPPRPEKHATRALEEGSASQSAEFAMQRAAELQVYLNELVKHPICHNSTVLRIFLALQDDLGTAWTECSGNALTRLASVGVGAAMKTSESMATTKLPWQSEGVADDGGGEDNAELLSLQSGESVRMGFVQQAVPKLEGAVTLLREHAELAGATGMELSRLVKEVQVMDSELAQPIDIVSAGMLRSGRRSKRLAVELAAAVHTFQQHNKLCRYEKMAFQDRKIALQRRHKERLKADQRAAQMMMNQRPAYNNAYQHQQQQFQFGPPQPHHPNQQQQMMMNNPQATAADEYANDVWNECEEVGRRLKAEVNRCAWNRRHEWNMSLKIIASSMKEAVSERVGIWETVRENFLQSFPEYREPSVPAESNGSPEGLVISGPPSNDAASNVSGIP